MIISTKMSSKSYIETLIYRILVSKYRTFKQYHTQKSPIPQRTSTNGNIILLDSKQEQWNVSYAQDLFYTFLILFIGGCVAKQLHSSGNQRPQSHGTKVVGCHKNENQNREQCESALGSKVHCTTYTSCKNVILYYLVCL